MTDEERRTRAVSGGHASAEVRRKKAESRKTDPLFDIKANLPKNFKDLQAAASGTGAWKQLPLQSRLAALLKVIEYGVGKPIGVDKLHPTPVAAEGGGAETPGTVSFE